MRRGLKRWARFDLEEACSIQRKSGLSISEVAVAVGMNVKSIWW
jgi:hypothetical protein